MASIFAYTDYREFVRDELSRKRRRNDAFSIRAAAARLGIGTGTLNRILNGTRNIGPALLPSIISFLGLKAREAEYFSLLVKFTRTANPGKKRSCYERMLRLRSESRRTVPQEQYTLFEHWTCLAIHQLVRSVPGCADAAALAAMLRPRVSAARARKSLEILETGGLLRRNEQGGYSPADISLTTGETWSGTAIHGYQQETARMASDALDRFPKEERDFSTVTVCLSDAHFVEAREILRRARQEILALDEKEDAPQRVYQINFQAFPLSRDTAGKRGEK